MPPCLKDILIKKKLRNSRIKHFWSWYIVIMSWSNDVKCRKQKTHKKSPRAP